MARPTVAAACLLVVLACAPAVRGSEAVAAAPETSASGAAFRDCGDCPEMMVLPAGSYRMGSSTFKGAELPSKCRNTG